MIIEMARVRVLGPVAALPATMRALQDEGIVHVTDASCPPGLVRRGSERTVSRRQRHLAQALADIEAALAGLAALGADVEPREGAAPSEGAAARLGARVRRAVVTLAERARALVDEQDVLRAYEPLFTELEALLGRSPRRMVSVYLVRMPSAAALAALREALTRALGSGHDLRSHALPSGETVVLLLVPAGRAELIESHLAAARVEQAPLPAALGKLPLAESLPRLRPRLAEVAAELAAVRREAAELAREHGAALAGARRAFHDALLALEAEVHVTTSARLFVLEGWLPARDRARLAAALASAVGAEVTIEELARHEWAGDDVPVVLSNPRLFAPFEVLTSLLPKPRYGSVDPTPFVAIFFPMLFGIAVGDVGYGLVIAALALVLRYAKRDSELARSVAHIALAMTVYTILFGVLFGELFGDLGTRMFGMHALWFDRREAVLAFLALAIAIGAVHLVVGLVVAAANRWHRDRRQAVGRGLTAMILILLAVALGALFDRLPSVFVMPSVIALLVGFAVVVVLEGATAMLDVMTIVNHVLSYARVMALGTASVMLAVVANRMTGAFGSVAVGVAFALVFHLVNFAIALFSPTIHVMRLHYVEFFGTFYEPGGGAYRPLRHWSPHPAGP